MSLPASLVKLPTPTPSVAATLPPQQLAEHRLQISVTVETVLMGYWQDRLPDAMRAAILADWCDELEDWRPEQVQAALRQWRRDNPNKRPNPGHISNWLKAERGKAYAARKAETQAIPAPGGHHETAEERRLTAERVRAIMAEVGIKRVGGGE